MHQHRSRRRRWLIVAFALVLVSLVPWLYWPRGDARFVGKWRATKYEPICLRFSSNGTGTESPDPEVYPEWTGPAQKFVWWAKGDKLTMYFPNGSNSVVAWFDSLAARIQMPIAGHGSWSFSKVEAIDATDLTLHFGAARGYSERFTRIPE